MVGLGGLVLPAEFICPITFDTMRDPVVASDGNSYERKAIAIVIERGDGLTHLPSGASIADFLETVSGIAELRRQLEARGETMMLVQEPRPEDETHGGRLAGYASNVGVQFDIMNNRVNELQQALRDLGLMEEI